MQRGQTAAHDLVPAHSVSPGRVAFEFGSPWTRRAKIPLRGITAKMIASVLKKPALLLEASIRGTAKDGGPACATVPLLPDWVVTAE